MLTQFSDTQEIRDFINSDPQAGEVAAIQVNPDLTNVGKQRAIERVRQTGDQRRLGSVAGAYASLSREWAALRRQFKANGARRAAEQQRINAGWDFLRLNFETAAIKALIENPIDKPQSNRSAFAMVQNAWQSAKAVADRHQVRAWGANAGLVASKFAAAGQNNPYDNDVQAAAVVMAKEIKGMADALMASPELVSINQMGSALVNNLEDLIDLTKDASQFFGDTEQRDFSALMDGVKVWHEVDKANPAQVLTHAEVNDPPQQNANVAGGAPGQNAFSR